jgi:hypothetical protein
MYCVYTYVFTNLLLLIFSMEIHSMVHSFADLMVVTSPQIYNEFVSHRHHIPRCVIWQKGLIQLHFIQTIVVRRCDQ